MSGEPRVVIQLRIAPRYNLGDLIKEIWKHLPHVNDQYIAEIIKPSLSALSFFVDDKPPVKLEFRMYRYPIYTRESTRYIKLPLSICKIRNPEVDRAIRKIAREHYIDDANYEAFRYQCILKWIEHALIQDRDLEDEHLFSHGSTSKIIGDAGPCSEYMSTGRPLDYIAIGEWAKLAENGYKSIEIITDIIVKK